MIGLDTNVLVRHIMQDDAVQSSKATDWIEHRLTREDPGFITVVTLVEMAWVLERAFGYSGRDIGRVIERILQIETLCVQSEKEIHAAMLIAKLGTGSFADALIGELCFREGCEATLTFDREASRLPGFQLCN